MSTQKKKISLRQEQKIKPYSRKMIKRGEDLLAEMTHRILRVPSEFPTIENALENASDDDIIEISPGVYPSNLVIRKGVVLRANIPGEVILIPSKEIYSSKNAQFSFAPIITTNVKGKQIKIQEIRFSCLEKPLFDCAVLIWGGDISIEHCFFSNIGVNTDKNGKVDMDSLESKYAIGINNYCSATIFDTNFIFCVHSIAGGSFSEVRLINCSLEHSSFGVILKDNSKLWAENCKINGGIAFWVGSNDHIEVIDSKINVRDFLQIDENSTVILSNNIIEAKSSLFNLGALSKLTSMNDTYYCDFGTIIGSSSTANANFYDSTIYCKFIYGITQNIRQQSQDEKQKEAILEWCPRVTASNAEISTESYFGYRIKEIPYNFLPKDLESILDQLLLIPRNSKFIMRSGLNNISQNREGRMNLVIDPKRGNAVARRLLQWFHSKGIFGHRIMPETELPNGMVKGSLDYLLFVTLTVSIDYMRDADELWNNSRRTFEDEETNYLYRPDLLTETPISKIKKDMQKHGLSKKPEKDAGIWRTIGVSFHIKWRGDPRNFLEDCDWDAPAILKRLNRDCHLNNGILLPDFPYLRGQKIGPLWLRMLRDNVEISNLKNLDKIPIPPDIHIARSTLSMGVVRGEYSGPNDNDFKRIIQEAWIQSVKGLIIKGKPIIALDLDVPLWLLSRYGCTNRSSNSNECTVSNDCEMKRYCIPGKIHITNDHVDVNT